LLQLVDDVGFPDSYTWIVERALRELAEHSSVPGNDGGRNFADHDFGRCIEPLESGRERVPTAQAPHQHSGALALTQGRDTQLRQERLRPMCAAAHQLLPGRTNGELGTATQQR
jgi:hypothetical protein